MQRKHSAFLSTIAGMSMLFLAVQPVLALDGKAYPGAACQTRAPESPFLRSNALQNTGADPITVFCPIVRDDMLSGVVKSAFVTVIDRHPGKDFICSLSSYSSTGTLLGYAAAFSSGSPATPQQLNFANVPSGGANGNQGNYLIECFMPPSFNGNASSVLSYQVTEEE